MTWNEPRDCELCGAKGRDIHYQIVEYADALPGMRYAQIARCDDRVTCRARVELDGVWPLKEAGRVTV